MNVHVHVRSARTPLDNAAYMIIPVIYNSLKMNPQIYCISTLCNGEIFVELS